MPHIMRDSKEPGMKKLTCWVIPLALTTAVGTTAQENHVPGIRSKQRLTILSGKFAVLSCLEDTSTFFWRGMVCGGWWSS
jgi:hypothetical protein